jgi:hypothetical protein
LHVNRQRIGTPVVATAFEAPAVVSGFDDIAVMGQPIEQRRCHLGVGEHTQPLTEGEIGGDDDRSSFVEPTDEME